LLHAAVGEHDAHAAPVLLDALEIAAEMVVRRIDGGAQQPLQAVPGGEDLPQRPLVLDAAVAVERDALGHLDAEPLGAGAARGQRVEQLGMAGDAGTAADQLDPGALVDVDLPADLAQEGGGEQPRHRAANDDGPPMAAARKGGWTRHSGRSLACPARLSIERQEWRP